MMHNLVVALALAAPIGLTGMTSSVVAQGVNRTQPAPVEIQANPGQAIGMRERSAD